MKEKIKQTKLHVQNDMWKFNASGNTEALFLHLYLVPLSFFSLVDLRFDGGEWHMQTQVITRVKYKYSQP